MISFEGTWRSGEVPEDWKEATVIPVFKKSEEEDPGKYFLASFTSIPGKVTEHLILEAMSIHIIDKKMNEQ